MARQSRKCPTGMGSTAFWLEEEERRKTGQLLLCKEVCTALRVSLLVFQAGKPQLSRKKQRTPCCPGFLLRCRWSGFNHYKALERFQPLYIGAVPTAIIIGAVLSYMELQPTAVIKEQFHPIIAFNQTDPTCIETVLYKPLSWKRSQPLYIYMYMFQALQSEMFCTHHSHQNISVYIWSTGLEV